MAEEEAEAADPVGSNPEHYRVLFENERVRVLEYRDEPGDATSPHRHPDSVMVTLSDFSRRLSLGDRVFDTVLDAGEARWLPAQTHSGENTGATPTHAIFVELKGTPLASPTAAPPLGPS
ncbi:cytoplasmic protein [Cryobacterium lactosi]|uniref:Cytoplasmic protein n=1 Tax=Cryobacterium lactosi TaxID=1259202 RepID=A0A4R9BYX7_9MICO|nr:cytoplasmic protein [Cryobacterium lactosi]TFD95117.1 cytoplasmic protein [Cryobacterium lactosi]